jgi:hypothetical protein
VRRLRDQPIHRRVYPPPRPIPITVPLSATVSKYLTARTWADATRPSQSPSHSQAFGGGRDHPPTCVVPVTHAGNRRRTVTNRIGKRVGETLKSSNLLSSASALTRDDRNGRHLPCGSAGSPVSFPCPGPRLDRHPRPRRHRGARCTRSCGSLPWCLGAVAAQERGQNAGKPGANLDHGVSQFRGVLVEAT